MTQHFHVLPHRRKLAEFGHRERPCQKHRELQKTQALGSQLKKLQHTVLKSRHVNLQLPLGNDTQVSSCTTKMLE